MKKTHFSIFVAMSVLALSMLLLPITTATFAQTTAPTPKVRQVETHDTRDNTGVWALLGVTGLVGLAVLRRPALVRVYIDRRERSKI
jgi:hypothetical protein